MTERDEIETLARAWRGINDDVELSVDAALRRQRRQTLAVAGDVVGGAIGLAAGIWFWLVDDGLVYRVSAIVLIVAVVGASALATRRRAALLRWDDWTPDGVLAFRIRDCEFALAQARSALTASAILVAFAAFVWLAAELGWDTLPPGFHVLYASVVACAVAVTTGWALWRRRTKRAELERLSALLAELRES